jgi:hypothetical protein
MMLTARLSVVGFVALLSLVALPAIARAETILFGYEGRGDGSTADMIAQQAQPLMDYLSTEIPEHDFQLRVYVPTTAVSQSIVLIPSAPNSTAIDSPSLSSDILILPCFRVHPMCSRPPARPPARVDCSKLPHSEPHSF